MLIQVAVETPRNLSARQRELLEQFETEYAKDGKGSPENEGFFARMRDFFDGGRS
jgi:molecular chaperone DnaJ